MMVRRFSGEYRVQPAISSRVRPQPKQYPVWLSIEQTRMQGDSNEVFRDFTIQQVGNYIARARPVSAMTSAICWLAPSVSPVWPPIMRRLNCLNRKSAAMTSVTPCTTG